MSPSTAKEVFRVSAATVAIVAVALGLVYIPSLTNSTATTDATTAQARIGKGLSVHARASLDDYDRGDTTVIDVSRCAFDVSQVFRNGEKLSFINGSQSPRTLVFFQELGNEDGGFVTVQPEEAVRVAVTMQTGTYSFFCNGALQEQTLTIIE